MEVQATETQDDLMRDIEASGFDQALLLATLFGLALSLGGIVFVFLLRAEVGSEALAIPATSYLRAFLLAGAIILMPVAFGLRHGVWSTATILIVLLALAFMPKWLSPSIDLMAVSVWAAAFRAFRGSSRISVPLALAVSAFGLVCAALYGLINLSNNYATPIAFEAALVGLTHHDTLFHAAIAESLIKYGAPSIGADGSLPLSYHVFSHRVIGGFADWLGLHALHGYGLFVAVFGVPVLVTLLLQASAQLLPLSDTTVNRSVATFSVLIWLVLGGALMWHSYYGSESYNLSLWFLILAVLLMEHHIFLTTNRLAASMALILLAVLVGMAALSKISVGFVLAAAVAAFIALRGRFSKLALFWASIVGILPVVAVYLAYPVSAGTGEPLFALFAFLSNERPAAYALLFALMVSFLAYRRLPQDSARRSLALSLICGMWAGLGASYVLNAPAGAQYYFSDPGSWLGLLAVPLLGMVPRWLSTQMPLRGLVSVGGVVMILLLLHDQKMRGLDQFNAFRSAFSTVSDPHGAGPRDDAVLSGTAVGRVVSKVFEYGPYMDAVVIAADYSEFWTSQHPCWAASMVVPALTGKPMLQGLVPSHYGCEVTMHYGLADYDPISGQPPNDLDKDTVCSAAIKRGFVNVLAISKGNAEMFSCK